MSCREVEDRIVDLQDGRLASAEELRLHAHAESCVECRARLATWQKLLPLMRAATPEPPSSLALRRMEVGIERRLAEHVPFVPHRSRWSLGAVGAAAAVAVALTGLWLMRSPHRIEQRVELAATQTRELRLGDVARLQIKGPARLQVGGDSHAMRLTLEEGQLEAKVEHRRAGESFIVDVPDGRIEVRGTRFLVNAARGGSSVRVDEGRVAVFDFDGTEHSVAAGETYQWKQRIAAAPVAPSVSAVAVAAPVVAVTAPAAPACAPSISCRSLTSSVRRQLRERRYGRALDGIASVVHDAACAQRIHSCRDELGYLDAEALRLSGRTDAAVVAYKTLNRKDAPGATRQNALYAAAQLERRMGQLDAARKDFAAAHAAAPSGALADEALSAAMRAAASAGDALGAATLARRYLEQFPLGLAATEARRFAGAAP